MHFAADASIGLSYAYINVLLNLLTFAVEPSLDDG
jgi:hypothetical protein